MYYQRVAANLSKYQRDLLIELIDGPKVLSFRGEFNKRRTWDLLNANGFLRRIPNTSSTELTDSGRAVLGWILGELADTLVRAGALERQSDLGMEPKFQLCESMLAYGWRSSIERENHLV